MRTQPYIPRGKNTNFQSAIVSSLILSRKLTREYTAPLECNPHGNVTRHLSTGGYLTSFSPLYHEICSKFVLRERQRPLDGQMVYTRLGGIFSAIHLNTMVTLALSFNFAPTVGMQCLAFCGSLLERASIVQERLQAVRLEPNTWREAKYQYVQAVEPLPVLTGERLPRVTALRGERETETSHSNRSGGTSFSRIDMPYSLTGLTSLVPRTGTAIALDGVHTSSPHQRSRSGTMTERVHAVVKFNGPQLERAVHNSPVLSKPSLGFAQRDRNDIVSRVYEGERTSATVSLASGLQPAVLTPMFTQARMVEQPLGATALQPRESHVLTKVVQPAPKERQPTEGWHPFADAGSVPGRQRRLGVSTIDARESANARGVSQDLWQLTVLREAERSQPPPLHYSYVPPARPIAQEEHVVIKLHEKEVIKVVQKEVQELMSSGSVVKYFSRADYTHLTDSVYSSLIKRILVEKERIGIR